MRGRQTFQAAQDGRAVQPYATQLFNYLRSFALSADVIDFQNYRRRKEEEKRSKSAKGLKAYNYSDDFTFGPDDLSEGFGVGPDPIPVAVKKEMPKWLLRIVDGEEGSE